MRVRVSLCLFVVALAFCSFVSCEDEEENKSAIAVPVPVKLPTDLRPLFVSKENGKVKELYARFLVPNRPGKYELTLPKTSRVCRCA